MDQNKNTSYPIRVLQVLTIMNRGGAETMVMNYYRHMDRSKVQFDFLLHREEEGVFDDEIKKLGGRIHRLSNISLTNLRNYQKLLDAFFKQNSDYNIVHSHLNALSIFVLKAAKKHKVPVRIAHSHTSLYNINLNPFSKKSSSLPFAIKFVAQNIFKMGITKYANVYYACGEKAGMWLFGRKNKSNFKIINNAIDATKFTFNKPVALEYKKMLHVNDQLVIGHVGNFVPEKNHSFILKVFKEVKETEKNAVLILVGGGKTTEFQQEAKDLNIEEAVYFLGVRNDVEHVLQAMDIFLFPSTNEGLPVTLIEAQASGLRIFASDDISKELNITGLVSFIALSESPAFWANQILEHQTYDRKNTSHQIVARNYDIKSNAEMLQAFYLKNN